MSGAPGEPENGNGRFAKTFVRVSRVTRSNENLETHQQIMFGVLKHHVYAFIFQDNFMKMDNIFVA